MPVRKHACEWRGVGNTNGWYSYMIHGTAGQNGTEKEKVGQNQNPTARVSSCTGMTIVSCAIAQQYLLQMLASVKTDVLLAERIERNESNTWNRGTRLGSHILAFVADFNRAAVRSPGSGSRT